MMSELSTAERAINGKKKSSEWPLDEFLAMVSHELRNPISAILGWADIIRCESPDAETDLHAIEAIKHSALHAEKLISQLSDFSRISRDALKLNAQEVALVSTLRTAIEVMQPQARAREIEIEMEFVDSPNLIADQGRLQQVFTNLLSNAVKFSPAGGRVRVHVESRRDYMEIKVSDKGCGISAEFLPYVFDRFRQDISETTKGEGLGLGLAIARYLIELHGGKIYADSPGKGEGATFTVLLPLSKPVPLAS
jgi:two-component system CheB/CheR fusion protein